MAERFVDPALSFTMGWNYCELFYTVRDGERANVFCRVLLDHHLTSRGQRFCGTSQLLVCSCRHSMFQVLVLTLDVRTKEVHNAVWITIFLVVVLVINLFGTGAFLQRLHVS